MNFPLSLAGQWHCTLDRADTGLAENWFSAPLPGARAVTLPGDLANQGLGDPVGPDTRWIGQRLDRIYYDTPEFAVYRQPGSFKTPFWLQPELRYQGVAWYQREIEIPAAWADQRVTLLLERAHWETRAWLDGREIGTADRSLGTPHVRELGTGLAPGRHLLTLRVDNSLVVDIGIDSHSVSDHTQGNWNGIVGRLELAATPAIRIEDLQVYPDFRDKSIRVIGRVAGAPGASVADSLVTLQVALGGGDFPPPPACTAACLADGAFSALMPLGPDAAAWDEFSPVVHRLTATLAGSGHARTVAFGLREVSVSGTQIAVNGRPILLRGTLECAIFPRTGHPPTDLAEWRRVLGAARAHGLNSIRFHSWCPPEAAFVVGDELGLYFQIEASSWANESTTLGDGHPVDAFVHEETDRILRAYGNHPCFVLMAYGNEPGNNHPGRSANRDHYLSAWVLRQKARDARRLYTCSAGWPELPENDYHNPGHPRIQGWGEGLASRINARPPETASDYRAVIGARAIPLVSHEIGQWCAYPNFDEIAKYTGNLRARNFEIFRDSLRARGLGDLAPAFLHASGRLQVLCYKEEIESVLRTPGMAGFQLLDLHDFPGQGTALVGVLDAFWESKGYVSAEEFRRFCSPTVPLVRLARRVFTGDDTLVVDCEIAHHGPRPLHRTAPQWRLLDTAGHSVAEGELPALTLPTGCATPVGRVEVALAGLPAPARYRFVLGVPEASAENDWNVWVYPSQPYTDPRGVHVASALDAAALATLDAGGAVFLQLAPDTVRDDDAAPIQLGFSSIFWNTTWTRRQAPTTLGILCDPAHPALADFPTEAHSDWQWWYLVSRARPMILDALPRGLRPIVRVIDDWTSNHDLALVFEARVGAGRLLISSVDFRAPADPVTRQLLASLLAYAASPRFAPTAELTPAQITCLSKTNA